MFCDVYRSCKKLDTYLYVKKQEQADSEAFREVPEALLKMLGKLEWVMEIDLTSRAQLAQMNCATLMEKLAETGYFLQLPPSHYSNV